MEKLIKYREMLREVLCPHLENLKRKKSEMSSDEFDDIVKETLDRILQDPKKHLTGIEEDTHAKMTIESVFNELAEN
jgi:hypothetical protein